MYDLLKKNKALIDKLIKAGVVDPVWSRDIKMFEEFQNMNIRCVMCKYTILAEKYKLSEDNVRKRIGQLRA